MTKPGYRQIAKMTPEEAYDTGYRNGESSAMADIQCGLEEQGGFPDGTSLNEAMVWVRYARRFLEEGLTQPRSGPRKENL